MLKKEACDEAWVDRVFRGNNDVVVKRVWTEEDAAFWNLDGNYHGAWPLVKLAGVRSGNDLASAWDLMKPAAPARIRIHDVAADGEGGDPMSKQSSMGGSSRRIGAGLREEFASSCLQTAEIREVGTSLVWLKPWYWSLVSAIGWSQGECSNRIKSREAERWSGSGRARLHWKGSSAGLKTFELAADCRDATGKFFLRSGITVTDDNICASFLIVCH